MENIKIKDWEKRTNEYLNKTSKHLFVHEFNQDRLFKVIPFKCGNKNVVATIKISETRITVTLKELNYYSASSLIDMKYDFFPTWNKARSIKNFKGIRQLTSEIKEYLENNYDDSNTTENKEVIKKMIENAKVFYKKLD